MAEERSLQVKGPTLQAYLMGCEQACGLEQFVQDYWFAGMHASRNRSGEWQ
jgi:hypothetical protein